MTPSDLAEHYSSDELLAALCAKMDPKNAVAAVRAIAPFLSDEDKKQRSKRLAANRSRRFYKRQNLTVKREKSNAQYREEYDEEIGEDALESNGEALETPRKPNGQNGTIPTPPPQVSPIPPSFPAPPPVHEGSAPRAKPAVERLPDGSKKSRPDSLAQVTARCAELSIPATDAEAIWCKWEGNGFTNDRKPMKNWHSVIRSWQLHGYLPSQKANGSGPRRDTVNGSAHRSNYEKTSNPRTELIPGSEW